MELCRHKGDEKVGGGAAHGVRATTHEAHGMGSAEPPIKWAEPPMSSAPPTVSAQPPVRGAAHGVRPRSRPEG